MSKETIGFQIEDYEATKAQVLANGWAIEQDNTTDLDENGRHTNCFFVVETEPPAPSEPTYEQLLEFYETMTGGG